MPLLDSQLTQTFRFDQINLAKTVLPIVTVSASYREDLKRLYGLPDDDTLPDIVFSRAHYSMAMAAAVTAWDKKMDPEKAWLVDPTNYVSHKDWKKIVLTETVGKTIARHPFLQKLKSLIDHFGRQKLPILESITSPLLHLTQQISRPILSFHIAAGNILVEQGKTVIQVVTDPHVRDEYVLHADNPNMFYCVFDEKTQYDLLEKASIYQKKIGLDRVIVTGPPIDPRVIAASKHKRAWRSGTVNICLTTGGLGTNKYEIRTILRQLLPTLRHTPQPYQLLLYVGTQQDHAVMAEQLAAELRIPISHLQKKDQSLHKASLNIIAHPQIVDANELLITHAFPWADILITKPSGDMAYDAAASGTALLTLKEWGVWEEVIRETFEQKGISRRTQTDTLLDQLKALTNTSGKSHSWLEQAMNNAFIFSASVAHATEKIIEVVEKVAISSSQNSPLSAKHS